jgi:hypothetical protein
MQNPIVPPQLKVVFDSPKFSGEQLFKKTYKGQRRVEAFLKMLSKNYDHVSVQITTV